MAGTSSSSAVTASFRHFGLRPCSSKAIPAQELPILEETGEEVSSSSSSSSFPAHDRDNKKIGGFGPFEGRCKGSNVSGSAGNGKGGNCERNKWHRDACAASSSSSSTSRAHRKGVHLRRKRIRVTVLSGRGGAFVRGSADVQELALPLGMSFAVIIALVLQQKRIKEKRIPGDQLSAVCISAVKEAVENVYGKRFEYFLRSFEKSFGSTLKTLQVISEADFVEYKSLVEPRVVNSHFEIPSSQGAITESFESPEIQLSQCPVETQSSQARETQRAQSLNHQNSQLVLHGDVSQHLAQISRSRDNLAYNQPILSAFERSVMAQTRSNDLKEFEIGLALKRLQLKQAQLDLNFYANVLEKVKIVMGFSKARFKEEKLKNQMQDLRHAELLRSCIDFLVAGLLVMSACLGYGTWVYSYRRINDATASCTPAKQTTSSWWVPKQMTSLNSSLGMLRCHTVVLTRMTFGLLMIVGMAYSLFQRSARPMMPVTFILLVLGFICGAAGKFCIDTLGGSGYWWLLHWEALCLLHFVVNAFPSVIYPRLYGPVGVQAVKGGVVPYWVRRSIFYSVLLLILPVSSGLIPFASVGDWRRHFNDIVLHTKEV